MRFIGAVAAIIFSLAGVVPLVAQAPVPVIDKTGLAGRFDLDFQAAPPNVAQVAARPPISTALEDQLGLKLQSGRGPVDVLVIDRLEKPSEN